MAGAGYFGNEVYAYYSDERLKEKKGIITNALGKILSLTAFYYTNNKTAKENGFEHDDLQLGLSAQEVQAIAPEIVSLAPFDMDENGNSKSGENYITVQYERIVPLLIQAINELKAEIELLKK